MFYDSSLKVGGFTALNLVKRTKNYSIWLKGSFGFKKSKLS